MRLTSEDVVCCVPPLFHCFGLVMGFLSSFFHGSTCVFPSDDFNAERVVDALVHERCTALLSVPTMFYAELEVLARRKAKISTLRTGLAAGSAVPSALMGRLRDEMGVNGILIAYGMTETSPVTFMPSLDDPEDKRLRSLGKVLPHTSAKIIDRNGNIVARNTKGELCTSGYPLQKGYYNNEDKTREAMIRDGDGVLWMHTGDECYMDDQDYCYITGRFKDIIIRGMLSAIA